MFKACATISNSMKFIFNEVHHEVELYLKHAQQSRENECDEVIAETFVEDEHRLQAAGPLCAALVYSHSLILNQICLAQGGCAFTLAGLASMGA